MRKQKLLLFIAVFFAYAYFADTTPDANVDSRMDLIHSAVNDGTVKIDRYHANTIDKAFFDNHYYSDKAPGIAALGIPVYFLAKNIFRILDIPLSPSTARYIITLFVICLPSALVSLLIFDFLLKLKKSMRFALLLSLAYSLCTPAFTYATLLYGHETSAALAFASFYLLFRTKEDPGRENKLLPASGFLAAYAVISEYPTGIIFLALFFYAFAITKKKNKALLFLAGAIVPALLLMAYNYLCFSNPFSLTYRHLSNPEFKAGSGRGFMGVSLISPKALYSILISPQKGLLFFSPFLILLFPGFYSMRRNKEYEKEMLLFLSVALIFVYFNASFYGWHGGWSFGARYMVQAMPFMAIPVIFCLGRYLIPFYVLASISAVLVFLGTGINPHVPDLFKNAAGEFLIPLAREGFAIKNLGMLFGLKNAYSLLPLVIFLSVMIFILIRNSGNGGGREEKTDLSGTMVIFALTLLLYSQVLFTKTRESDAMHYSLARTYDSAGMRDKAVAFYEKAIELNPEMKEAVINLGIIYYARKRYDRAKHYFEEATRIAPRDARAYNCLGAAYASSGSFEEAESCFRKALLLDPSFLEAQENLDRIGAIR